MIIHSNNGKKHIALKLIEKDSNYVFWDLWFGYSSCEYFSGDVGEDCSFLVEEVQTIMDGKETVISVTNPRTKKWIAGARFDRNDTDDALYGEVRFQKAMKRIRKKKTFFQKIFCFSRRYEIYDWNSYECITK